MMASRGLASQSEPYDLAVVGGGPGGYVAAIKAAQSGLKVSRLSAKLSSGQRNMEPVARVHADEIDCLY
jgi:flavin-dependent dehydrogenase